MANKKINIPIRTIQLKHRQNMNQRGNQYIVAINNSFEKL